MHHFSLKFVREAAKVAGKKLIYNRTLRAYQIVSGFEASEIEYPERDENGNLYLNDHQCKRLLSYLNFYY